MNKRWLFSFSLATLMLLSGALSPAVGDSHTPGEVFTAPAPTKSDASGVENDGFYIPEADFEGMFDHPDHGYGGYHLNGANVALEAGFHKLPKAASSVTITTDWDSGTWTFDFTDTDFGEEAKNQYRATLGECAATTSSRTEATLYVTNVDDETNLPIKKLTLIPRRPKDPIPVTSEVAEGIQDGETREIPIMDYQGGLFPGTWHLNVYIGGFKKVAHRVVVWVPACGDSKPPVGDYAPGEKAVPRATMKLVSCTRMKAILDNRRSTVPLSFLVTKIPTESTTYRVQSHVRRIVRFKRPAWGSKLFVEVDGKVVHRMTVTRGRRC